MKLRNVYLLLSAVTFFTACQNDGSDEPSIDRPTVAIVANIGNVASASSRYEQSDNDDNAKFSKGDLIGVFMNSNGVVSWSYDAQSWIPTSTLYWENRETAHQFYAYYPYVSSDVSVKKTEIPMPSLDGQDGTWQALASRDFLAAFKSVSYKGETDGVVRFTGEYAFMHISSLLKLTLNTKGELNGATIKNITITRDNLITSGTYSFESEKVTLNASKLNSLSATVNKKIEGASNSFYFIVNGTDNIATTASTSTQTATLAIEYEYNGKTYIAEKTDFNFTPVAGSKHFYNIQLKSDQIIIEGGTITGWNNKDGGTIIIEGEEQTKTDTQS